MAAVLDQIARYRLVPVVVADSVAEGSFIVDALAEGGLPVAEITFRTAAAPDAIAAIAARGDILVGAGTIVSPAQVDTAVDAGARFLVSPGFHPAVADRAAERGVPLIPGAISASEITAALAAGITTVKFFPAETSGGLPALRALAAPFGDVRFVPTGGIDATNLDSYLAHPRVMAVGGSWMLPRDAVEARDAAPIVRATSDAVARVAASSQAAPAGLPNG
ncbi:2-dehydro-3-deoxyphosphogluconatealdolase/4-hydroxy-2-oxoglutarate aldolase [Microbacterium sp. TS-1]|uniref:bifunctional 4-hydroxy-2-oxoglutarate aldolase/2-dehydro-3-deoxy-phosphogluconate aldolase n=1 Tax=Microbacterium sp. TS-1 TaxID=1344956 RepID=UPI00038F786C|nr:bifunctional 4-hydroxy-2-oxoglutarate aldolase/2-dehydro-3-deoxy-phosphogluconate aldolase [Microbacterium sp. TS-1]GAD32731.1 2-dehydro-3-deoxyphosphogluconatealdolase/4-hydroxy-2-oxoglutarate aldolase [Microbacterium sp. TS-1]